MRVGGHLEGCAHELLGPGSTRVGARTSVGGVGHDPRGLDLGVRALRDLVRSERGVGEVGAIDVLIGGVIGGDVDGCGEGGKRATG